MKKQGMYSFLPRAIIYRTSIFNPINLLYNFESCYQEQDYYLREQILNHRKAAYFSNDFLLKDSSWFQSDFDLAFENINKNSYLFSSQFRPRQKLSMNDFRVIDFEHASFKWESIRQLEVDISDFLLTRNELIEKRNLAQMNDPMNFFFFDIKHIVRSIIREKNTEMVQNVIASIGNYISYVETELPFDSQDRAFIGQIRESIRQQILPQIIAKIDSDSIREKFETLKVELDSVIDEANRIGHYSFHDSDISPHATSSFNLISQEEIKRYPTLALIDCASEFYNKEEAVSLVSSDGSLVLNNIDDNLNFNVDLLDKCENVHLMNGLSATDKGSYVMLVSQINNLLKYKKTLKLILQLFEDIGQQSLVAEYKQELSNFILSLTKEIKVTKHSVNMVDDHSQKIKNKLLSYKITTNTLDYMLSLSSMLRQPAIDVEKYIKNQDIKYITQSVSSEKIFDKTLLSLGHLSTELYSWWTPNINNYMDEVDINGYLYNVPEFEDNFIPSCYFPENRDLTCNFGAYDMILSNKESLLFSSQNIISGGYDTSSCQFNLSDKSQSVVCQNENTRLTFFSKNTLSSPEFVEQVQQQFALGVVLFKIGTDLFKWFFYENKNITEKEYIKNLTPLNITEPLFSGGTSLVKDNFINVSDNNLFSFFKEGDTPNGHESACFVEDTAIRSPFSTNL